MKIHFIGIGGIGISALAQFCHNRGDEVSGSNLGQNEVFPILKKSGITNLYDFHNEKNIPEDCDLVVYTEAILLNKDNSETNCELKIAKEKNIPLKSYFELLGDISHDFRTIAIAGTHGKTTTTGLLATGLLNAGFDATFFVGSTLKEFNNSNFHAGTNEFLIVEACEYRENFKFLQPEIVVLTNVEFDHADAFQDEEHYLQAFKNICAKAKTVIYHEDDKNSELVATSAPSQLPVTTIQDLNLQIPGQHNRENATLAVEVAKLLNVDSDRFQTGLENFSGAGRRQEFLSEIHGVKVFDDYGHHPTEIKATIAAFREKYPKAKINLIYEPHQFSRTKMFFPEFCEALKTADNVGLFPIYEARDSKEDKKFKLDNFFPHLSNAKKIETTEDVTNFLENLNKDNENILIFMGAGNISTFAHKFLNNK